MIFRDANEDSCYVFDSYPRNGSGMPSVKGMAVRLRCAKFTDLVCYLCNSARYIGNALIPYELVDFQVFLVEEYDVGVPGIAGALFDNATLEVYCEKRDLYGRDASDYEMIVTPTTCSPFDNTAASTSHDISRTILNIPNMTQN